MNIKTGDKVKVIAGKDKGKDGEVLKVLTNEDRIIVKGINMIKKHEKPSNDHPKGGVIEKEAALHVSNVALLDSSNKTIRAHKRTDKKK